MQFLRIWEFLVKPDAVVEFEREYAPDGAWAHLFRRSRDFLGTELIRDLNHPGRYVTIDRWSSRGAFDEFKHRHAADYAALDEICERLTEGEMLLGDFESATGSST